jgi:hypothetical protein
MPSVISATAGGTGATVGANYLRTLQSPGADLAGLVASGSAPLLTFSTPNLRMFKVVVNGVDLTATPAASDSAWSKTVRGLQVTSELFAVFAPAVDGGNSTFCYMAPDFNTNAGDVEVSNVKKPGDAQAAVTEANRTFSIVETAIKDATGASSVVVTYAAVAGTTVT